MKINDQFDKNKTWKRLAYNIETALEKKMTIAYNDKEKTPSA